MVYLLASIFFSATIGLLFKYSETNNLNRFTITFTNYFVAASICFITVLRSDLSLLNLINSDIGFFWEELLIVIRNKDMHFSDQNSLLFCILLGGCTGWLYFSAFIYYQISVAKNGINLSAMFSRLGILIPMLIAIFFWQEIPTKIQFVGILMSLSSIVITNLNFGNQVQIHKKSLLSLFFFAGLGVFCNKIFQKYALIEHTQLFLFCIFGSALLVSIKPLLINLKQIVVKDISIGILIGISNLLTTLFLISALNHVAAAVVFPLFSAGAIVLVMLGGKFIFRESMTRKNLIAILMTIIALVIINLKI